ncbi:DUF2989 domain-containing protein [Vibrio sp. A14(2019)]|nr:DUF2989 domain-containing protein [Vibrio sp. A14(2019)]
MIMNGIKIGILLLMTVLLSGCLENRNNTDKLCNDNPGLQCEKLNLNDGQCRLPRTDLIWHRFEVLKNPTVDNKLEEYRLVRLYRQCLELASQIQVLNDPLLTQNRFNALVHSGEELDRLTKDLRQMRTPHALYFLWSQTGDNIARREFLRMEGSPELDTAEMQYALATFYISRDREKTIQLLTRALELSSPRAINTEIFQSLASTHQALGHQELAYLWAMVGKQFDVPVASPAEMALLYPFNAEQFRQLDNQANQLARTIRRGEFSRHNVPVFNER